MAASSELPELLPQNREQQRCGKDIHAGLAQRQCLHNRLTAGCSRKPWAVSSVAVVAGHRLNFCLGRSSGPPPATARPRRSVVARASRRWLLECEFAAMMGGGRRRWRALQKGVKGGFPAAVRSIIIVGKGCRTEMLNGKRCAYAAFCRLAARSSSSHTGQLSGFRIPEFDCGSWCKSVPLPRRPSFIRRSVCRD